MTRTLQRHAARLHGPGSSPRRLGAPAERLHRQSPSRPAPPALPASGGASGSVESFPASSALPGRRALLAAAAAVLILVSVLLLLPALAGLPETWGRIAGGDPAWLALALGFEALSFLGHILLFRAVCLDGGSRIQMRESYEITLAGHAATRLFASGGAGGVALTAWALRRSGMERRDVASRMITFLVLLYSVYMAALLVGGVGLATGILPGDAPLAMTLAPAALAALVIVLVSAMPLADRALERRLERASGSSGRLARAAARSSAAPAALAGGVRSAARMAVGNGLALAGAALWWFMDIAVLWACFEAFGAAPPVAVIVMAYFVGMLANLLPLPGGVGGVDGGMIGAFLAFGADPGLAVVAVISYRLFAFWLPIVPGAVAFLQLRRTVARWSGERDGAKRPQRTPPPSRIPAEAPVPAPALAA
jgi:uncharacterized protein (TIRG00374 family)